MLNHEEIKTDPQRKTKINPFINKYNWEGLDFSALKKVGKTMRKVM